MANPKRLVREGIAVNADPPFPVRFGEVPARKRDARDDPVKTGIFETQRGVVFCVRQKIAATKRPEVFRGFRHMLPKQTEGNSSRAFSVNVDVEENGFRNGRVSGWG